MGLLNKKDDDASKVLERMMDKFEIDLDEVLENDENNELSKRRQNKKKIQ